MHGAAVNTSQELFSAGAGRSAQAGAAGCRAAVGGGRLARREGRRLDGLGQVQAEARALRQRLRGVPQLEEDHECLLNCLGESELEVEGLQEQLAAADAARASAEQGRCELEQVGLV